MNKRTGWIRRQIQFFRQYHPRTPERQYQSGETHLYLGRRYRLKVMQALQSGIKLKGGYIEVHTHYPSRNDVIRSQVEDWFKACAHEHFEKRLEACLAQFPDVEEYRPRSLIVRQLKQRWGSMTAAGRLVLNRSLIHASLYENDYVITHELCHRRHHHHGPAFFELLDRVMPDWAERKVSNGAWLSLGSGLSGAVIEPATTRAVISRVSFWAVLSTTQVVPGCFEM